MAKKRTIHDRLADALIKLGEQEIKGAAYIYRYRKFTRKEGGFFFLGRSTSLRVGVKVTGSRPVHRNVYNALLESVPS